MDNDIVGRLRKAAQPKNIPRRIKTFDNAADEIERLRLQIDELVDALHCVIAVADRDTEDFRFAKSVIAKVTGEPYQQ